MVQLDNGYARTCKPSDDNSTQICACDSRINIYRCDRNEFFIDVAWISLTLNVFIVLFSSLILYHLVKIKRQPIWLPYTRERGLIRYFESHTQFFLSKDVKIY